MSTRLRVGNLGFDTDETKFKELFAAFGTVTEAKIMISDLNGKSRGFGFIEMSSPEEAAQCMTKMNGEELFGQKLVITEAPPEKKRARARSAR